MINGLNHHGLHSDAMVITLSLFIDYEARDEAEEYSQRRVGYLDGPQPLKTGVKSERIGVGNRRLEDSKFNRSRLLYEGGNGEP